MRDLSSLAAGDRFAGRYEIERLLKAGGMGAVYIATHTGTRRRVAIKLMHPDIVADAEARARFVQEAQVATIIRSVNVVDVLDAGVDEATGLPFLAMELLQGQELGDLLIARGRLPAHEVVGLLQQAARALDRAHAAGIVHRDLKPENLYLSVRDDEPPRVKILDFGIAKVIQGAQQTATRATGTPLYMAPEQTKRSSAIGAGTDIWALGLIAYTLIVGRPYWEAQDLNQLFAEILVEGFESAVARAGRCGIALPPAFDGWFFRCVNREPSMRFSSAGEAIVALGALFGIPVDMPPSLPLPYTAQRPSGTIAMTRASGTPPPPPPPPPGYMGAATTSSPMLAASGNVATSTRALRKSSPIVLMLMAIGVLTAVGVAVVMVPKSSTSDDDVAASAKSKKKKDVVEKADVQDDATVLREQLEALNPFLGIGDASMQRHEVSREEFSIYVASLPEKERAKNRPLSDWSGEPIEATTKHRPVTWIPLERAQRFCKAVGAKVPTSEQWGSALDAKFPWGNDWPDSLDGIAVARGDEAKPIDVQASLHDKTADGIYDLAGNVQEWTSTIAPDGNATLRGGSISMAADDAKGAIGGELTKLTEKGAGAGAKTETIAGSRLGFRCVRVN